jgi:hypothetical protein
VALRHRVQLQRGELHAVHFFDGVIEACERSAQRVAAGSRKFNFVPRIFGGAARPRSLEWSELSLRGAAHLAHLLFADAAFHLDPIRLAQAAGGAQHARGKLAVAGEQHETAREIIEAADRENSLGRAAQEIAQSLAALGIGERRNHLRRLVQNNVNKLRGDFRHAARGFHSIVIGIGLRSEFGDDFTVDAYLAAANQFFGVPA